MVDQVFVSKGDNVKKDDPLISFDTTLVEMELNIAKLKKQKQEQDLTKAANRLNSLLNGGPVQESDSGTDADNTLDTTTGSDSEGDDDMTPDSAMSSAADFSGNYLAAAIHPYLLAAFTDGTSDDPETDTSGEASSGADADNTGNTDDSSADTNGSSISETPSYTDPSASEFGDGQDNNSFNSGDNNDTPQLSPTPTPVLDDHTSCFDPYYKKGDPNFTDGNEPFYQKLNGESIPFTGTGKKDDPYVFLCSSAKGKVTVTGSFFNKLAGYSPDGTRIVHEGGYWYQLEFHENDTIADYENRKESCTGYYLINGSLLENPVYEFSEVEFTLDEADKYDRDDPSDDDPSDDPGTTDDPEPPFPEQMPLSIREARSPV